MFIAVYGIAIQSMPETVADWKLGLIHGCLTAGILLFMMFPKDNKEN